MHYLASLIFTLFILLTAGASGIPVNTAVQVEIYTIPGCFGCGIAKSKFEDRGIPYKEISLQGSPELYRQMKERVYAQMAPGDRGSMDDSMTVPRIFINGKYIGSSSDLDGSELDKLAAQIQSHADSSHSTQAEKENNSNENK